MTKKSRLNKGHFRVHVIHLMCVCVWGGYGIIYAYFCHSYISQIMLFLSKSSL